MTTQMIVQWLPGIAYVAIVAFVALFIPKRPLLVRLLIACVSVMAALFLFGALIGHQFTFWRTEDLPPLVIGFVLALVVSETTRALLAARKKTNDSAA